MRVTCVKKKKNARFRFSFILLFFAASFLGCFVFYMKENQPKSYYKSGGEIIPVMAAEGFSPVRESSPKTKRYLENCVFAGGDTAKRLAFFGSIPDDNAYFDEELTAENILKAANKEYTAGIYFFPDISSEESFEDDISFYRELVCLLKDSCEADIYIVSVLPDTSTEKTLISDSINAMLLDFCGENGINFLDAGSELKNKDGVLPEIYITEDGIEKEVCGRISSYILSHTVN